MFYGGGAFFPDDRLGRPGFKRVLPAVAHADDAKRDAVLDVADKVHEALAAAEEAALGSADLSPRLAQTVRETLVRSFDATHGGFGPGAKFPPGAPIALAFRLYAEKGATPRVADPALREARLRERAAPRDLPPRLQGNGAGAVSGGRRRDHRLHGPGDVRPRARGLLCPPGRGHETGRPWGVLHVDRCGGAGGAAVRGSPGDPPALRPHRVREHAGDARPHRTRVWRRRSPSPPSTRSGSPDSSTPTAASTTNVRGFGY